MSEVFDKGKSPVGCLFMEVMYSWVLEKNEPIFILKQVIVVILILV